MPETFESLHVGNEPVGCSDLWQIVNTLNIARFLHLVSQFKHYEWPFSAAAPEDPDIPRQAGLFRADVAEARRMCESVAGMDHPGFIYMLALDSASRRAS